MVCKAFLESLESSNFVRTMMKLLSGNQQDLCFIYFLLKSGCPQDGWTATGLKPQVHIVGGWRGWARVVTFVDPHSVCNCWQIFCQLVNYSLEDNFSNG